MSIDSEIDFALHQLGSVVPPPGMEQRLQSRLHVAPRRASFSVIYGVTGGALAASVAALAITFNPSLHRMVFPQAAPPPRVAPVSGGFGAAGVVRVPVEPVPVQPTPNNQGRGRSRSGRATLPAGSVAPLPRGVAPAQPVTH